MEITAPSLSRAKSITINIFYAVSSEVTLPWISLFSCCCYLTLWPLFLYFSPAFSFVFIFLTIQNFDNSSQSPQLHSTVLGFDCTYVYKLYVEGKVPMGFIYCACKGRYFNAVVLCTKLQTLSLLGCKFQLFYTFSIFNEWYWIFITAYPTSCLRLRHTLL